MNGQGFRRVGVLNCRLCHCGQIDEVGVRSLFAVCVQALVTAVMPGRKFEEDMPQILVTYDFALG